MIRALISATLTACSLAMLYAVVSQRQQLRDLRAEQQRIVAQLTPGPEPRPDTAPVQEESVQAARAATTSPALLELRNEVTRLSAELRNLSALSNENARLRAEISRRTSAGAGSALPPGYVRAAEAQLAGFDTPEHALESFVWAAHNRDLTTLQQAVAPTLAEQMGIASPGESAEKFFKDAQKLPGIGVLSRRILPDGTVELEAQMVPGLPSTQFDFRQIDGQWRLSTR